jgi:hypothetical protein
MLKPSKTPSRFFPETLAVDSVTDWPVHNKWAQGCANANAESAGSKQDHVLRSDTQVAQGSAILLINALTKNSPLLRAILS